jgi:hypothetical protein
MRAYLLIAVLALSGRALLGQSAEPTPCAPGQIMDHACILQLARGAGALEVPPLASIGPLGKNPDGSEIVLEDSTVVEVWVTESPVTGALASSGSGIDSLWHADTAIAGRTAELMTAKVRPRHAGAWHYFGTASVTVDGEHAINMMVWADTPSSRDAVLRWLLGRLRIPGAARPTGG